VGKEVSRRTEAKIKALLARGLPSDPGKLVGGGTGRYDCHVRITGDVYREQEDESESESGSGEDVFVPEEWVGYWPGVITHWNPTEATWIEFGPCLVLPANFGDFVVGKRYRALNYGNVLQGYPEWERLVFVADDDEGDEDESGSGDSIPCPTASFAFLADVDVTAECVDGVITVMTTKTTKTATVTWDGRCIRVEVE
jgi:hypothetical protein